MATNIYISKASGISFVIQRGIDTISNNVADTDFNYLDADIAEFFNCPDLVPTNYCQKWKWGDTIYAQFQYLFSPDYPPIVRLLDSDGDLVQYIMPIDATATYALDVENVYEIVFDTSDLPEPQDCTCYTIEIGTMVVDDTNFFACADFGTFEAAVGTWAASTGGNNTLGQSVSGMSHEGNFSGIILSDAAPNLAARTLFYCDSATTLTADNYYVYSAWVYIDSHNPIISAGRVLKWDVSEFTDANVVYQTTCDGSRVNTWVNIVTILKTNSDLTGTPKIVANSNLLANGKAWIDQLELFETNTIAEALSQTICICDDIKCSLEFFYYPADEQTEMGIVGGTSGINSIQSFNVNCSMRKMKFDDGDSEISIDSARTTSQVISRPVKIYTFKTGLLPQYMVEKIMLAAKFSNVLVRPSGDLSTLGVYFVMESKAPNIDSADDTNDTMFTMEFDMVLRSYNYTKGNC